MLVDQPFRRNYLANRRRSLALSLDLRSLSKNAYATGMGLRIPGAQEKSRAPHNTMRLTRPYPLGSLFGQLEKQP
jgi:hypothetical protein